MSNLPNLSQYLHRNRPLLPVYEDVALNNRLQLIRSKETGVPYVSLEPGGPCYDLLLAAVNQGPTVVTSLMAESHVNAMGPKIFRPTREQLIAMARTEPRVSFNQYRQPFPSMVIEYPPEGHHGGFWTIVLQTPYSIICCTVNADGQYLNLILSPHKEDDLICNTMDAATNCLNEDSLPFEDGERGTSFVCARTAINACLLLTMYGSKRLGVDNPSHEERLKRYLEKAKRGKGKGDVERAQRDLNQLPVIYGFAQEVDLTRREKMVFPDDSEPTGRRLHPHWRSGHIRTQHYGTKHSESKLIYIAPVMVNAHLMLGRPADTLTVYRSKE